MVAIDDLYNIASVMDEQMLVMNMKHKEDFREDLYITLEIPELDFMGIDQSLYEKEHKTMIGYEVGDEINITILGINFILKKRRKINPSFCYSTYGVYLKFFI